MLEFKQKLEKLYILNQKNINKVNDNLIKIVSDPELLLHAYSNIQTNKESLTPGVDPKDTVCGFNSPFVNKISKQIKEGTYQWKNLKKIMIPKPGEKEKTAWNTYFYRQISPRSNKTNLNNYL